MSRKKSTEEPRWQIIEKIVVLLEKALTPLAMVEHNVYLPVLGRLERKPRQCDIVITCGQAPRQTITIVEVQKRKSRPSLTTFHGWIEKMREVGAQHLICVSALGFPQSIIDDVALRYGPTVRLTTLQELEELSIPGLILGNQLIHKRAHFVLEAWELKEIEPIPTTDFEINTKSQVFSLNERLEKLNVFELFEFVRREELLPLLYSHGRRQPDNGSLEVNLASSSQKRLYLHIGEQKYRIISLSMKWKIETEILRIPLAQFAYKQEFINGTLAWLASATGDIEGKEFVVQIVFNQDERGFLQVTAIQLQGIESLALELYTDEDAWRSAYKS